MTSLAFLRPWPMTSNTTSSVGQVGRQSDGGSRLSHEDRYDLTARSAAGVTGVDQPIATADEDEAMRALRRMKAEASLLIAIADIGGVWPVPQVTQALTELSDCAVQGAVRFLLNDAVRRERLSPDDPSRPGVHSSG